MLLYPFTSCDIQDAVKKRTGFWFAGGLGAQPPIAIFLKAVIPAQAGIQLIKSPREAGQNKGFVRFAEYLYCWIPACAGMTV